MAPPPLLDHLTTQPPELLLAIISHLPPSTLYPLSQTSKSLHHFLQTHAATICNTQITTHYLHAASILQSKYNSSGWLLPTHPCIHTEEQRLLRDKILFSRCRCPPCRQTIMSTSNSSLSLSELESGLNLDCLSMLRPSACKARKSLNTTIKLSSPGPQYLLFLSKYSWEIETRSAMSSLRSSPSPTSTSTSNGTADSRSDGADVEEKQDKEKAAMFEFMIGNYCVRRFLESAESALASLSNNRNPTSTSSSKTRSSPKLPLLPPRPQRNIRHLLTRLAAKLLPQRHPHAISTRASEEVIPDTARTRNSTASPSPSPRRMMFGEISPSQNLSNQNEKSVLISQDTKRKERWEEGLFWYYSPLIQGLVKGEVDKQITMERGGERGCFAVFRNGVKGLGRKMVRVVKGCRCSGGFWALDG